MNWIPLTDEKQLDELIGISSAQKVLIFKHSTRCNISSIAKSRLEQIEVLDNYSVYYLDLIQYRPLSNSVAERFQVHHESPQLLLIENGDCTYEASHLEINKTDLLSVL